VQADLVEYLAGIERGVEVSRIERDLDLPAPFEIEAPAYGWPHWKFKYRLEGQVVYFEAERVEGEVYRYVGNWDVYGDPIEK
jgi:hypothetical protein